MVYAIVQAASFKMRQGLRPHRVKPILDREEVCAGIQTGAQRRVCVITAGTVPATPASGVLGVPWRALRTPRSSVRRMVHGCPVVPVSGRRTSALPRWPHVLDATYHEQQGGSNLGSEPPSLRSSSNPQIAAATGLGGDLQPSAATTLMPLKSSRS